MHCPWRELRMMLIPSSTATITKKYLSVSKSNCMNWNYLFWSPGKKIVAIVESLCSELHNVPLWQETEFSLDGYCSRLRGDQRNSQRLSVALSMLHTSLPCGESVSWKSASQWSYKNPWHSLHLQRTTASSVLQAGLATILLSFEFPEVNSSLSSTPSFISLHPPSAWLFQLSPHKFWLFFGPQNHLAFCSVYAAVFMVRSKVCLTASKGQGEH